MVALHYADAAATSLRHSHRRFPLKTLNPRKSILFVCCFATSFPAKSARRKNYLRQKILKTLKEPIIRKLPPADPIIPSDSPRLQDIIESETIEEFQEVDRSENSKAVNGDVQKIEALGESEVSVPAGVTVDGNVGIVAKNPILKYGLWLVGAWVFQTVCAIWVFGSAENTDKILNGTEKSSIIEAGGNGEGKSRVKFFLNGNGNGKFGVGSSAADSIVYVDELEMERKIEEIRAMAREAREKERLKSNKNGFDNEDSEETDGEKHFKSGVEEEVDNRLIKLRKKLENARDKQAVASVGYSRENNTRKDGVDEADLDERGGNGALLFEKKYKFKDLSGDPIEKPKGFIGSSDKRGKSGNQKKGDELFRSGNDGYDKISLGDGKKQKELSDVDPNGSEAIHVVEEDTKKGVPKMRESTKNTRKKVAKEGVTWEQGKGKGVARSKVIDGIGLKKDNGKAVKSRKSSALDTAVVSNKPSKGNHSLKGKAVGDVKSTLKSGSESELWWLNLPYVLAILMRRGDDGEREGFYTLKSISPAEERISHIVAFEDRADASNFCYLLQSFFKDLEDFQADVVPLTVKELIESVKSYAMRVIVVKRGNLKLYAGQPLADAEMALRAMIKQN